MDISILIVSFNTCKALRECLRALPEAVGDLSHEIIVVDNASEDGTAEMLSREHPQISLIANRENIGFARACNQAIKASSGGCLLFLNSDTIARPLSLGALAGYLSAHPRVGAVGPRLYACDGRLSRSCFRFPSLTRPYLNFRLVQYFLGEKFALPYARQDPIFSRGGPADWLSAACLLVRRQALEKVGPFDERYFMYFEDIDLCRRLRNSGWDVVYWPKAEVLHSSGASSHGQKARLRVEDQRSRLIYFSTHHPGLGFRLQCFGVFLAALMRSARWLACFKFKRLGVEARIMRLVLIGNYQEPL